MERMIVAAFTAGVVSSAGVASDVQDGFIDRFKTENRVDWRIANYDFSHPHFATDWRTEQVQFNDGLRMKLSPEPNGADRFHGASLRRPVPSHFGRYEAVMRPSDAPGVVTGFFTYTGAYYGTQHDEIDIEFLGRDPKKLHVAWFVDGKLNNRFIDLGFDASEKARRYGFEWHPDRIGWYVEDRLVFEVTDRESRIPQTPSYLFANIWAADPSISVWSGLIAPGTHSSAEFTEISFRPWTDIGAP